MVYECSQKYCLSYLTGYPAKLFMLFIWRFLVKHQAFWSWTFFDSPLSGQIKIEQKGLLYYVTFGDETFACCLIPWGHYTAGSKKIQPLVYMWFCRVLFFYPRHLTTLVVSHPIAIVVVRCLVWQNLQDLSAKNGNGAQNCFHIF